jgi:hypothetical protein
MDHVDRVARAVATVTRKRLLAVLSGDFERELASMLRDEFTTALNDAQLSFNFSQHEKDRGA